MKPILLNRFIESTFFLIYFYVTVVNTLHLSALNGILLNNLYQHGVLPMNILRILRERIKKSFPEISHDELELRINYAYELIKNIRK
jgi:hypothetical protein